MEMFFRLLFDNDGGCVLMPRYVMWRVSIISEEYVCLSYRYMSEELDMLEESGIIGIH